MRKGGFDPDRAVFLAAVCSQTYELYKNKDGSFAVPQGFRQVEIIEAKSFDRSRERFGFILESDREILIAFRGTISTSDWVSDALAYQVPCPYAKNAGQTHQGFTQIYRSARAQIVAALKRLPPDKPIYATGHSLGGALATLCALDLASRSEGRPPTVYTYGAPRVGDPAFVKAFNGKVKTSFRIANPFDPVAQLPPFVLRMPASDKTYYYNHVRSAFILSFQAGSLAANHALDRYYEHLAGLSPDYALELSLANPGLCPEPKS
ncbi:MULTISPECIES: lipase family protein [Cohnella]|uniref:lipase family protein n=1 Tax=Cohnella TaxID=329857 RepID=UPI0009BB408B|nr:MULTISPECIES: lipase family protein [Cohnella]MBN2984962.1 lipase family protein [Cohnella algarum]